MALTATADNPTAVNPFNGVSDETQAAAAFERLYQADSAHAAQQEAPAAATQTETQERPAVEATQEAGEHAAQGAQQEAESIEYANLDDYLQKSNLERDSFLSLPVTVKVDGAESQVPLKDLLRAYQTDAHVTQKSQRLADQQKAWETEQAAAKQALTQQLQTAQTLGNLAHQQLLAEYQGIDWNRLRAEDPVQWAVRNQEFQQRANAIQQHLMQVQAAQQQQAAQAQQTQAATIEAERAKLLEAFPEWRDPAKFQAARTELVSYARQTGFSEAELAGIADHRYLKVLHDASRFAALQAKSPSVLKQVRAAPVMASPGARVARDPVVTRIQQARERLRANPRDEAAQARAFSALVDAGA